MGNNKPSGKVGAQDVGRGAIVGRDPKPDGVDKVDAGVGRAAGLEHKNAADDRSALNNLDHVENDNPISNPLLGADRQSFGDLDDEGETMEEKVAVVEGVQSGGGAAQDDG